MWSLRKPNQARIDAFLKECESQSFSYPEVGATRSPGPAGYDYDHNRIVLGSGEAVFERACNALRKWSMFPTGWTEIRPQDAPLKVGQTVAMLARAWGFWWLNSCRIVYLVDEHSPVRRFGFAYGTLPRHVEQGEECFVIEMDAKGTVTYDLRAFSRPRYWMTCLGYPLVRRLQRRFVRQSQEAMLAAVRS